MWGEEPSFEENERHLQEELICHYPIREALSNFLMVAQKNKISVHGKSFNNFSSTLQSSSTNHI
jgi:S-adenosylmethionine:tRNA-ribosyltransferase-isomerase (queuine synthetase)